MPDRQINKQTVSNIQDLPTLPEVASKLFQIINAPDTSANEVAELIAKDPGITAKVLRLANSAFYGIPRTITTVQNAVVLLGMKVVHSLVLSVSVGNSFSPKNNENGLDRRLFWRHSLATAICGRMLAQRVKPSQLMDPEECFCSGLLHDIGKLVLDQYFTEEYVACLEKAKAGSLSLTESESEMFGSTHSDVGNWLTSKWELPRDLKAPIILHHKPETVSSPDKNACIIHVANYIVHAAGFDLYEGEVYSHFNPQAKKMLNITDEPIDELKEMIGTEIEKIDEAFSFSSGH